MFFFSANSLYTDARDGIVMDPRVYNTAAGDKLSAYFEFSHELSWLTVIPATRRKRASH